jgi:beta-carotene/zeaxanthin 4-ketolase
LTAGAQEVLPASLLGPRFGLAFALAVLLAWTASLIGLLVSDLWTWSPAALTLAVLMRTLLQSGLFIVGHDAMHRTLLPGQPQANDRLGQLVLTLYALLPWRRSRLNHRCHHRAPGSPLDPDFHGGTGLAGWFRRFLGAYLAWPRLLALISAWTLLILLAPSPWPQAAARVLLAWILPLLLSALQLFVVGTVLPHRRGEACGNRHRAESLALPPWLSLLACYHFGYHWEHHEYPQVPWFGLAIVRRQHLEQRQLLSTRVAR